MSQPYFPPEPRGQRHFWGSCVPSWALCGLQTLARTCRWSLPSFQSDSCLPLGLCSSFSLAPSHLSSSGTGHLIVPWVPSSPGFACAVPSAQNALPLFASPSPQSAVEITAHPELSQPPPVPLHPKSKISLALPFAKVGWLSVSPTNAPWHFSQPASYLPARADASVSPHLYT